MKIEYASITDIGKVRENNEDNHIVITFDEANEFAAAVADGMGGHLFGEIASRTAIESFEKKIRDRKFKNCTNIKEYLLDICRLANKEILNFSKKHGVKTGMGTTLDAIYIKDKRMYGIHVGDSRIYILHDDGIRMITKDHSYVQHLLDKGDLTVEEMRTHPRRNIITRALGIMEEPEPDYLELELDFDGYLLLCSDGLTGMVDAGQILNIINQNSGLNEKLVELVQKANDNGGKDNITIVLVKIASASEE